MVKSTLRQLAPAQIMATLNEVNDTQARHVAGQAAMRDPRIAQLVSIFTQNDRRGQDAMICTGVHNLRYKKESTE